MRIKNIHSFLLFSIIVPYLTYAGTIKAIECNTQGSSKNYIRICIAETNSAEPLLPKNSSLDLQVNEELPSDENKVGCVLNEDGSVSKCIPQPEPVCGEGVSPKTSLLITFVQVANKKVAVSGVIPLSSSWSNIQPVAEGSSNAKTPPISKPTIISYSGQHYPTISLVNDYTLEVGQEPDTKGRVKVYVSRNNKLILKTPFYLSYNNLVDKTAWCEAQPESSAN